MLVPILTFVLGAATGGLLVKRERTPMQILAAVTGMVLLAYAALLVSDGLFLYLDYLDSRKWLAGNLLNINPLLLQALATAMALLHFTVAPSILWAFASLQHRRFAILTGTLVCGSLLAMYVVSPQRYFDPVGNHLYNFSRDSPNCIHLYNVEVKFDPNTGAELRGAGGDIVEEYQRQKTTHSCAAPGEEPRPRPTSFPRPVVLRFARPPEDRLKTPPFTLPGRNYSTLPAQGTNIWSESVSLAPGVTLLKLAIQGWNESPGWVQPAVEDATYLTDQAGNRYRLLADYGRYTDSCPSGAEILRCHKTLAGEVYRFELAFESLDNGARQLRLYYSGLGGPFEAAAFTSPIGDWRRNPNASAVPAEVVQSQPAVPPPSTPSMPQQPAAEFARTGFGQPRYACYGAGATIVLCPYIHPFYYSSQHEPSGPSSGSARLGRCASLSSAGGATSAVSTFRLLSACSRIGSAGLGGRSGWFGAFGSGCSWSGALHQRRDSRRPHLALQPRPRTGPSCPISHTHSVRIRSE